MILLLVMYASPLLAAVLFWRAHFVAMPAGQGDVEAGESPSTLGLLRELLLPRIAMVRSVAGAFGALALVLAWAAGPSAGAAFVLGACLGAVRSTMAWARPVDPKADVLSLRDLWSEAARAAISQGALAAGFLGTAAWFFADPSGVPVLVSLAAGAAVSSLFATMTLEGPAASRTVSAGSPLRAHLCVVVATAVAAASAPADALLPLGGLLAETETLRSELLLLPVALTVLSPVLGLIVLPIAASMLERRGAPGLDGAGRVATVGAALAVALLLGASGLSWTLLAVFLCGLLARELAYSVRELTLRTSRIASQGRALLPPVLAVGVFLFAERLAGSYGVAIAAAGLTTTFVTSTAVAAAASALGVETGADGGSAAAQACAEYTAALALLGAAGSAVAAESVRLGTVLPWFTVSDPALLAGVLAGAAAAVAMARQAADPGDERQTVALASRAVLAIAAVPVAGAALGSGAAVGACLGVLAVAAGGSSAGRRPESDQIPIAWAATMAMGTLVAVPITV